MKKVFISQPMAGRSEKEIKAERLAVMDELLKRYPGETFKIAETFSDKYKEDAARQDAGNVPLKYMGKCLWAMADADFAYFCQGWENARGCRIERLAAEAYGVPIVK